jgi:hypothetical protein
MTRRPWTARDQITAEVAAACGISWTQIGQILGRAGQVVKRRVDLAAAKKHEKAVQQWRKANIDKVKESSRRYREANKKKIQEAARKYYEANQEKVKEKSRLYYASNSEKQKENGRKWREANPEKWRQINRRWKKINYEMNRQSILETNRQWRVANLEKVKKKDCRYYQANKEKLKDKARFWRRNNYKKYYEVNCERILESGRQWRKANIEKVRQAGRRYYRANKQKRIEESRRRDALRRAIRAKALLPLTLAGKDARFALWSNRCAFCGVDPKHPRNHGYDRLTVDHVLALTKHGLDEASNIVPSCSTCNSSKNAKPVESWYRRQPFFTEEKWRKICRHCPGAVIGQLPLALPPADAEAA